MLKNSERSSNWRYVFVVLLFGLLTGFIYSCNYTPAPPTQADDIAAGKELAKTYCTRCHQLPDPFLIDKKTWVNSVLPAMGLQLGVQTYMGQYFADKATTISISDWQKIVTYYKNTAKDSLVIPKHAITPLNDWAIFSLERPAKIDPNALGMTTMISVNPADHQLYTADVANNLYRWDANLNSKLVSTFPSPVTALTYLPGDSTTNSAIVTCIGNMPPVNQAKGKVFTMNLRTGKNLVQIADSLPRSVETIAADFNKDGLMDYVICGFGHDSGALYLLQQQADHSFKKKIINGAPGSEQAITGDFNNDGWTDIMCLFAQADEGIWMFLNDHKGGFVTKNLMHFQPVFGSSSFQLADFNHDGKPDILYTCGDNSDYSRILKPYHGVYIFTNQGNWKFKQTYFYHIDGCTKAIATDFDHDGDLDIAAIAFFSDFKYHPQEAFTYLEQTNAGKFTAHELPVNNYGRWLTMAVGDIDKDGNDDIILGNFSVPGRGLLNQQGFKPQWDMHEPIIVLKNMSGKKR